VLVLFNEYEDCNSWLSSDKTGKDFHIGNLYDQTVNNFFTVLFFKPRSKVKNLYIYPTLSWLGDRLIEESNRFDDVIYAKNDDFLRVLSCFDNEVSVMKNIRSMMTFITGTKGDFTDLSDPSSKLIFDLVRTIIDSAIKIRQRDYHKMGSILPTKYTKPEPCYTIMKVENGTNTGIPVSQTGSDFLFFINKADAECFKMKNCNEDDMIVGVDQLYWNHIRDQLIRNNVSICLCLSFIGNSRKFMTVNEFDSFVQSYINQ